MGTLRWSVADHDRHRLVTVVSVAGLAVATALAVAGLPPIDLHGPLHGWGIMDPLCGGTRAVRFAMKGQIAESLSYNPMGVVVLAAAAAAAARLVAGVLTRRWLTCTVVWTARGKLLAVSITVVLIILLEVLQQGRAGLLVARF